MKDRTKITLMKTKNTVVKTVKPAIPYVVTVAAAVPMYIAANFIIGNLTDMLYNFIDEKIN